MFGKDDNQSQQDSGVNDGVLQASMPDPIESNGNSSSGLGASSSFITPANSPAAPPTSDFGAPDLLATAPELPNGNNTPAPTDDGPTDSTSSPATDELINLKQQALQQLSPLVSHLDQTPEEKFRTTMMMIQASDDQTLIKSAFEAAQTITDDKARAQALLDVINEINYFSQHQS